TAILEVAVHKGFRTLDTVPHVLTAMEVLSADRVQVVHPENVPNQNWLVPGIPGRGQQDFGDRLLREHPTILIPSAVSRHSWNLVSLARAARREYGARLQEPFALDTRLHPPAGRSALGTSPNISHWRRLRVFRRSAVGRRVPGTHDRRGLWRLVR